MVPVGGAILATLNSSDALVDAVSKLYPGPSHPACLILRPDLPLATPLARSVCVHAFERIEE